MTTHLTEDELVLHYYGELTGTDESRTVAHLSACSACHESFRHLQRVLAVVDESALAGPELPVNFERTVWAKLEPNLHDERRGWWSWFVVSPSRLAWAAMVVILVAAAFAVGRVIPRQPTPGELAASAKQIREGILLIDIGDHLDRSQMVLVELASADDQGPVDVSEERTLAEQLLSANRMYRQTAMSTGDTGIANLLDIVHRMRERDHLHRRHRRLLARQRLEFLLLERALDRTQPVRPLRMAHRRQMIEAGRVAEQERGHADRDKTSPPPCLGIFDHPFDRLSEPLLQHRLLA